MLEDQEALHLEQARNRHFRASDRTEAQVPTSKVLSSGGGPSRYVKSQNTRPVNLAPH
jgi:hypothetical protein